jgi:heptosyltransferase-2
MKILVFRLSSLGDVILSTAFLENLPEHQKVDWVVAKEFEFALKGHPRISRLIAFDKKSGLSGWMKLVRELAHESYDYRVDLHCTLRTRLAFFWFRWGGDGIRVSVSKERIKTLMLLSLKKFTPRFLIPTPYWLRFARAAQQVGGSISNLLPPSFLPILEKEQRDDSGVLQNYRVERKNYFCVMPASRWVTKEWGARNFFDVITALQTRSWVPVILGREQDHSCRELKALLERSGVSYRDALREDDFKNTAILLKNARFYLGCDTGLSHLAESVECPALVVFGPTQPELGFGPARNQSTSISAQVTCSPCSKDGRVCYRFDDPYVCMRRILPEFVLKEIDRCGF